MPVATSIGGQRKHCIVNCQILWLPCSAEDPITTTTTYSCLQLWSHIGIHLVKTPHWQKCTWYSPLGSGLQVLKQIGTTLIPGFATVHIPRYVTPSRAATTKLSQLPPSTMPLSPTQPSKPPPDTSKNLFSPPGLWGLSSWSPNSTCLHLDFYLLSWWWQPFFFFKISFLCIFCPWHSKKQGKKQYYLIRS